MFTWPIYQKVAPWFSDTWLYEIVYYSWKSIFKSSNFAFKVKIFVLTNSETIIGHSEVKCWGDILSSKTLKKRNIWAATMDVCPSLRLSARRSKERRFKDVTQICCLGYLIRQKRWHGIALTSDNSPVWEMGVGRTILCPLPTPSPPLGSWPLLKEVDQVALTSWPQLSRKAWTFWLKPEFF